MISERIQAALATLIILPRLQHPGKETFHPRLYSGREGTDPYRVVAGSGSHGHRAPSRHGRRPLQPWAHDDTGPNRCCCRTSDWGICQGGITGNAVVAPMLSRPLIHQQCSGPRTVPLAPGQDLMSGDRRSDLHLGRADAQDSAAFGACGKMGTLK
jgi:hypothetical protein